MKKYCHWVLETLPWWTSWDGQSYCWLSLAFLHTSDFGLFMWLAPRVDRSPQRQVVQSLSGVELFVTPWTAACQASLSFTISRRLLKLVWIESVMPSVHDSYELDEPCGKTWWHALCPRCSGPVSFKEHCHSTDIKSSLKTWHVSSCNLSGPVP